MVLYGTINESSHHHHRLILKKDLDLFICDGCREIGLGDGYTCEGRCDFQLHKQCSKDLNTGIRLPNFDCNFVFLKEPARKPVVCNICGDAINGYVYCCKDNGCRINLHPLCGELPQHIWIDEVGYDLGKKINHKCTRCKCKKLPQVKDTWSYHSSKAEQQYHVLCMKKLVKEKWEEANIPGMTGVGPLKYAEASTSSRRVIKDGASKMEKIEKSLGVFAAVARAMLGIPALPALTAPPGN